MESLLIAAVCNADLCAKYPGIQKRREILTCEEAIKIHENYDKKEPSHCE